MINSEFHLQEGVLVITPTGPLMTADFELLKKEADPYIEEHGGLNGLMIYTRSFPGWDNFAALISHLKFVKDHHRQIKRVAAVTDNGFLAILPRVAKHFVNAEVRHFDYEHKDEALEWLING
jgi:hypothetical protein